MAQSVLYMEEFFFFFFPQSYHKQLVPRTQRWLNGETWTGGGNEKEKDTKDGIRRVAPSAAKTTFIGLQLFYLIQAQYNHGGVTLIITFTIQWKNQHNKQTVSKFSLSALLHYTGEDQLA